MVQSRWNSLEEEGALAVRDFLSYERVMEINPFEVAARPRQARPQFERRLRRAVALLQIAPLLGRRLISLSNGERQKVQLARALAHPMRLLILDEPFAGLDAAARAHFHAVLERLMDTPLRVLLITTRAEDLPRHITHLLCVARCRVAATGPRAAILSLPRVRRLFVHSSPARTSVGRRANASARRERKAHARPPIGLKSIASTKRLATMTGTPPTTSLSEAHRDAVASVPASRKEPNCDLVRMRHITVRYGKTVILNDIHWTIRAGESWALLGPNGSGKTTLLSLILGDNPQVYTNDVVVFGRQRGSGESVWDIKKHIGWVSPELHLHFNDSATCFEVVASGFHETVGLFEPSTVRQQTAARRWMARFGLLEFADQPAVLAFRGPPADGSPGPRAG